MSDTTLHYWLKSSKKPRPKPNPIDQLGQIGIWMILTGIAIMLLYPAAVHALPDGFFTPIIAYEFVETEAQVVQLFGEPGTYQFNQLVHQMNQGNLLDLVFMGLYTWFIWGFGEQFGQRNAPYLYVLCALSPVILFADLLENMQLLTIPSLLTHAPDTFFPLPADRASFLAARQIGGNGIEGELQLLNIATWIKWFAIALSLALAGKFLLSTQGRFGKITAVFCLTAAALGVLSYLNTAYIAELFGFTVFISFILLTIYTFKKSEHPPKTSADTKAKG